ncbi:MAG: hypothetical protein AAFZ87_00525 [Planctomycetota bacterium]
MNSIQRPHRARRVGALLAPIVVSLGLAGCEDGETGERATITKTRLAAAAYADASEQLSLEERLMGRRRPAADETPQRPALPSYTFDLPEGWKALPPRQFREVNLRLVDDEASQLTVATFQDRAGARANLDRWRREVGAGELTDAEYDALERRTVLGAPAVLIEARGPYAGMGGMKLDDAVVMGAVGKAKSDLDLFVKLVVAADRADAAREAFDGFLASLRVGENTPPTDPRAPQRGAGAPSSAGSGGRVSPLTWAAPSGWSEEPPTSQFREVTFRRGGMEMYLSLARGDVAGNVARWAGQLGQPAPDDAALAALERVPSLGVDAVVYEGVGSLTSMRSRTPVPGQRMLAAIVRPENAGGTIVTLKLTGPDADVAAAKPDFMDVLSSLEMRGR